MWINLTQYKLLIGKDIIIDDVEYSDKADVSKMCGFFTVNGEITSKHNHDLESAMELVKSLIPDQEDVIDEYTLELIDQGVL